MSKKTEKKLKRRKARKARRSPDLRVMKERSCGPCYECCTVFRVYDLPEYERAKPEGETCKWVTDNIEARCGTYHNRPPVCGMYECIWLKDGRAENRTFLANERPDVLGVLFDLTGPEHVASKALGRPVLVARECRPSAYDSDAFLAMIERLMSRGHVVALVKPSGEYEFRALNALDAQKVAAAYMQLKQFKVLKANEHP